MVSLLIFIGLLLFIAGIILTFQSNLEVPINFKFPAITKRRTNSHTAPPSLAADKRGNDTADFYRQKIAYLSRALDAEKARRLWAEERLEEKEASVIELVLSMQKKKTLIDEIAREKDYLTEDLSELKEAKLSLEKRAALLENELDQTKNSVGEKIDQAKSSLQEKVAVLTENCTALMREKDFLENRINSHKDRMLLLQRGFDETKGLLMASERRLREKNASVAELVRTVQKKESLIRDLIKEKDDIAKTLFKTQREKRCLEGSLKSTV